MHPRPTHAHASAHTHAPIHVNGAVAVPLSTFVVCIFDLGGWFVCSESPTEITGSFTEWTKWTSCSTTNQCNEGVRSRERACESDVTGTGSRTFPKAVLIASQNFV